MNKNNQIGTISSSLSFAFFSKKKEMKRIKWNISDIIIKKGREQHFCVFCHLPNHMLLTLPSSDNMPLKTIKNGLCNNVQNILLYGES